MKNDDKHIIATCIYCNQEMSIPYSKDKREGIIEVKQRGKHRKTLYAHCECYMKQTKHTSI